MTLLNATSLDQIQFRQGDSQNTLTMKLEFLRQKMINSRGRALLLSITDGLPSADPDEPLVRLEVPAGQVWHLGPIAGSAGDAATGTPAFRLKKDGADNGTITFSGSLGGGAATETIYPSGSIFELYPPIAADMTLDDVSLSIPVTVS